MDSNGTISQVFKYLVIRMYDGLVEEIIAVDTHSDAQDLLMVWESRKQNVGHVDGSIMCMMLADGTIQQI